MLPAALTLSDLRGLYVTRKLLVYGGKPWFLNWCYLCFSPFSQSKSIDFSTNRHQYWGLDPEIQWIVIVPMLKMQVVICSGSFGRVLSEIKAWQKPLHIPNTPWTSVPTFMYLQPGNSGKLVLQHSPCRKVHLLRSRPIPHQQFRVGIPRFVEMVLQPKTLGNQSESIPSGFEVSRKWGSSHWDFSFQSFYIQSIVGDFHSFPLCAPKNEIQTTEGNGEIEGNGFKKLPGSSTSNPIWHRKFVNFYYIRR